MNTSKNASSLTKREPIKKKAHSKTEPRTTSGAFRNKGPHYMERVHPPYRIESFSFHIQNSTINRQCTIVYKVETSPLPLPKKKQQKKKYPQSISGPSSVQQGNTRQYQQNIQNDKQIQQQLKMVTTSPQRRFKEKFVPGRLMSFMSKRPDNKIHICALTVTNSAGFAGAT